MEKSNHMQDHAGKDRRAFIDTTVELDRIRQGVRDRIAADNRTALLANALLDGERRNIVEGSAK